MNKHIENVMATRETVSVSKVFKRGVDPCEGDIVQIRPPGHHSGRLGVIIGIAYFEKRQELRYNVMFSDKEAALFPGMRLELVKAHEK